MRVFDAISTHLVINHDTVRVKKKKKIRKHWKNSIFTRFIYNFFFFGGINNVCISMYLKMDHDMIIQTGINIEN